MEHYLFNQLAVARAQTLKITEGLPEEYADRIPEGFRNSIRWNLGHIYVALDRLAFQYIGLPLQQPQGFKELFEFRTSPSDPAWSGIVPSLQELRSLLGEQPDRIREALAGRMKDKAASPYTTSAGFTLETPEQFLSFALYHEGMHFGVLKTYLKLLSR